MPHDPSGQSCTGRNRFGFLQSASKHLARVIILGGPVLQLTQVGQIDDLIPRRIDRHQQSANSGEFLLGPTVIRPLQVDVAEGQLGAKRLQVVTQFNGHLNVDFQMLLGLGEITHKRIQAADIAHHECQLQPIIEPFRDLHRIHQHRQSVAIIGAAKMKTGQMVQSAALTFGTVVSSENRFCVTVCLLSFRMFTPVTQDTTQC